MTPLSLATYAAKGARENHCNVIVANRTPTTSMLLKETLFTARIQFKHKIAQRKEKQNNSRWTFSTKQIIYATTLTHTEKVDKSRYHCNSQLLTEFTMMAAPKIISGKMSSQTSATIYLGGGWVVGYSPSTLARPISMFAYVYIYVLVNMYEQTFRCRV